MGKALKKGKVRVEVLKKDQKNWGNEVKRRAEKVCWWVETDRELTGKVKK